MEGLRFGVYGLGLTAWGFGLRACRLGLIVEGGFKAYALGLRV